MNSRLFSKHHMGHGNATYDIQCTSQIINECKQLELSTFDYIEHNILDMEENIDPDINLFSLVDNKCQYHFSTSFEQVL